MFEHHSGDEMKNNNEIGRTCGMYWEQKKRMQIVCIGKPKGKRKIGRRKRRWKILKCTLK